MLLRTITELTLIVVGVWTAFHLWDMPGELIKTWRELKKAQGLQSQGR